MNPPSSQPASTSAADLCSIIMPCYNRAAFLAEAIDSIKAQQFTNWELIVVDDGSTDDTKAKLDSLTKELSQPVHYIHQPNAGAYAARNTGLDHARGEFIAFFDSDDLWLPHHLNDAIHALHHTPELSWVYSDARKIEQATGKVVAERGFYEGGRPHPMLRLRTRSPKGFAKLRIYDDRRTVTCELLHNLCCLLQASVIRARVFASRRFVAHYRNEGEDELFPIRVMKAGFKLGYLDDVHLIYRVHGDNASGAAIGAPIEKRLRITEAAARGYEELPGHGVELTPRERCALWKRIANEYFWKRGYALYWQNGMRREALAEFRRGLERDRWNLAMWKTYWVCRMRAMFGGGGK